MKLRLLAQYAQPKTSAEQKITNLPAVELFWRIVNFGSIAEAEAAAGPHRTCS